MTEKYTGKPCRRCGGTERYASNKHCIACETSWRHRTAASSGDKFIGRKCEKCGTQERYARGHACIGCQAARSKTGKRTPAYKARAREYQMLKRYQMSESDMRAMLHSQGGLCACCGGDTPGHKHGWFIDHDHNTGAVRGILCHGCNLGLGGFNDSPAKLQSAIRYLERSLRAPVEATILKFSVTRDVA